MNLELSEEQKLLQDAVEKFFRQESTAARLRAAEPLGHDAGLWAGVVGMGLPMMRVPLSHGGGAMSLLDALLVAELADRHLVCAPLIENMVVARLLARAGGEPAAGWLLRLEQWRYAAQPAGAASQLSALRREFRTLSWPAPSARR